MSGYGTSPEGARRARERSIFAVDELNRSTRLADFRSFVAKAKGPLTSFDLAMGVLGAAGAVYAQDPFTGAMIVGAAGKKLHDLWRQAKAED